MKLSIEIMYTKIYKIFLGYIEKILIDFVLKLLKVLKYVLKLFNII
jgi:hypothetical protein